MWESAVRVPRSFQIGVLCLSPVLMRSWLDKSRGDSQSTTAQRQRLNKPKELRCRAFSQHQSEWDNQ